MMRLAAWLARLEDALLVILLTGMILLAVLQILLRNFWGSAFLWADPLLRIAVLWVGLLGALVAARENKHISIDLLTRYLPPLMQAYARVIGQVFAAVVCALLASQAFRFVAFEYQDSSAQVAGLPIWILEGIMPAVFGLLALRFLAAGYLAWRRRHQPAPS